VQVAKRKIRKKNKELYIISIALFCLVFFSSCCIDSMSTLFCVVVLLLYPSLLFDFKTFNVNCSGFTILFFRITCIPPKHVVMK
jgi:hypothetical protein